MIMEQAVMLMDATKYNKLMNNTFKISASILLEQDIDPFYFFKISASILLEQDIDPFFFPRYRPPYFWTRYDLLK